MTDDQQAEIQFLVRDPNTGSCVAIRDDGKYVTLIRLRGEWHFFAQTTDPDEARHHYKYARMMFYGESWEMACGALERHDLQLAVVV